MRGFLPEALGCSKVDAWGPPTKATENWDSTVLGGGVVIQGGEVEKSSIFELLRSENPLI